MIGCVFLGVVGANATQWGALHDYVDESTPANTGKKYLLRKVLNGESLSVGLLRDSAYAEEHYDELSRMIAKFYDDWFFNAAEWIEKSGREDEFADILPILREGIRVRISEEGNDVNFTFTTLKDVQWKCGSSYSGGCLDLKSPIFHIYLPYNISFLQKIISLGRDNKQRLSRHEIGHTLGLSDQYVTARSINSDPVYGSTEKRKAVMGSAKNLTCDDAEGIINLIDITRNKCRGGDRGWKTICPKSKEYYICGMSAGKGPYRIKISEDNGAVILNTYEKGKKVSSTVYPFATPQGDVDWEETPAVETLKSDVFGRPVKERGPKGEIIYYSYLWDRVERLSVQNNHAIDYVAQLRYTSKIHTGEMEKYKERFFGQRGVVCLLKMYVYHKGGYRGDYREGVNKPKVLRYIKRVYNRRRQLLEDVYEEPTQQQNGRNMSTKDIIAQGGINQRIGKQAKSAQRDRLSKKLDRWLERTLQELSR